MKFSAALITSGKIGIYDALDARTGKFFLNDVSSSSPITFAVDGKQYIALAVGEGGFHARRFAPLVPELRSPPNRGATLWVFALPTP